MGFLSKLLNKHKSSTERYQSNDSYGAEVSKCMIEIKLTKVEYRLFSINYYKGSTSYRDYFYKVFMRRLDKIKKITDAATKKAKSGCNIDFTFIRFINSKTKYIDIPFEVFSQKKNMPDFRKRMKLWHKENIKRILIGDPTLRNLDDEQIQETMNELKKEILS